MHRTERLLNFRLSKQFITRSCSLVRLYDNSILLLSLPAKHSLQDKEETIQYSIGHESLHVLLKCPYDMFTDGQNTEKPYSVNPNLYGGGGANLPPPGSFLLQFKNGWH